MHHDTDLIAPFDPGVVSSDAPRRRFFVNALALGAAAAAAPFVRAQDILAPASSPKQIARLTFGEGGRGPSRVHPSFVKDVGLLTDLNHTNQGGAWWNFDTYITPVSQFYIRNAYPTPRPELDRRVDPRHWRLKIHGDAVERALTLTYDDLTEPRRVSGNGWGLAASAWPSGSTCRSAISSIGSD